MEPVLLTTAQSHLASQMPSHAMGFLSWASTPVSGNVALCSVTPGVRRALPEPVSWFHIFCALGSGSPECQAQLWVLSTQSYSGLIPEGWWGMGGGGCSAEQEGTMNPFSFISEDFLRRAKCKMK